MKLFRVEFNYQEIGEVDIRAKSRKDAELLIRDTLKHLGTGGIKAKRIGGRL